MKRNTILALIVVALILTLFPVLCQAQPPLQVRIDSVLFLGKGKAKIFGTTMQGDKAQLLYGWHQVSKRSVLSPGIWLSVMPMEGKKRGKYNYSIIKINQ